jgi:hypothetical protein
MKILIAIPTYRGKDYCWIRFFANMKALYPANHQIDYVVVDNSKDPYYVQYLRSFGIHALRTPPQGRTQHTLANTHNLLREYFLKGDYDYMFHLESDLFPPTMSLVQLLEIGAPVACGLYYLNKGLRNSLCLFKHFQIGIESGWQEVDTKYMAHFLTGKPERIYAAGIGCALIRRDVLESIKFRWVENSNYHPDMFFYEDCHNQGITVMGHTGLIVPHENQDWYENYSFTSQIVAQ